MEKFIAWMKTMGQNLYIMLLIVGGYLAYLAYDLFTNAGSTEGRIWPIYLAAVLFGICGVAIVAVCLLALVKGYYSEKNQPEESPEDEIDDAENEAEAEKFIDRY